MESVLFLVIVAVAIVACIIYILAKNYDNPDLNNDGKVDLKDAGAVASKVKAEVKTQASKVNQHLRKKKK